MSESTQKPSRDETLNRLFRQGSTHAINELTGEIVRLGSSAHITLHEGNVRSPAALCQLLFDEDEVNRVWNAIGQTEARARLRRINELLSAQ